ncbi:alpha/beta fold hydrolase [Actinophytocola oryzae]|uniref:Alpha/beta hydrolase family protein n=1 Tax=Actinophytocola oryzae TaxID=502181 RepID=A0A4V3FUP0_9PSEU|nr:alpha/beta hydrolase [Actinophytocola oryzae]TDV56021.1 alpha/beta hydrolase family protein [Actinophytocola oryzae]
MFHNVRPPAALVLCCVAAAGVLAGCDEAPDPEQDASRPSVTATGSPAGDDALTGTTTIDVGGRSVNVDCSGRAAGGRPVVVLMAGLGDGLDRVADLQQILGEKDRVCSYDRLGEGKSDQPADPQSFETTGDVLTGVLDRVAGEDPVVLVGHSLGGLIAARYAPEHRDRVAGVVLLDATPPTMLADTTRIVPESATGQAAELRAGAFAVYQGETPEKLVMTDGEVRSAGDIPVEVVQHGQQYLAAVPEYGPALEQAWSDGQRQWLALSGHSRLSVAADSGHYIYVDQPDVAVEAIQRVVAQAAQ